jgi:hypothetical protein
MSGEHPTRMKASPRPRSSAELLQEISAKRRVDLVEAAHRALVKHLGSDKAFAKRYPTFRIQLYRSGNEVGLGRVPIGVEKRNGAFFRKDDHPLRAVLQDGFRRNTPWESIPASRRSRVTRDAARWGS